VSELREKVQTEMQRVLQEQHRSQEVQNKIKHLEVKYKEAEQQCRCLEDASNMSIKENEAKHREALDELKQQHTQAMERLKRDNESQVIKSRAIAEKEANELCTEERKTLEETFSKEKKEIQQKLNAESEKVVQFEQTIQNMKGQHALQLKLQYQKAEEGLIALRHSLTTSHEEVINTLRSKISQLQLENQDLEIQLMRAIPKSTPLQAIKLNDVEPNSKSPPKDLGTVDAGSNIPHVGLQINCEKPMGKTGHSSIAKSQNRPCSSMSLKRIGDLATELEPNSSHELNSKVDSTHTLVDEFQQQGTPNRGHPLTEDQEHIFSLASSSESGFGEMIQQYDNPFLTQDAESSHRLNNIPSATIHNDREVDAIPFKMSNLNQEFRSSVPPSTSGSVGSVSILARKTSGNDHLRKAAESQKYNGSKQGTRLRENMHLSNARANGSRPSSTRGTKRSYGGMENELMEHVAKKPAPGREIRNIHRGPSNRKTYGTRSNNPTQENVQSESAAGRFNVVGQPHVGKFSYNRPPTAKTGGGRSRRVLNRSSQYVMTARFEEELR
jgi:hypothetical protein